MPPYSSNNTKRIAQNTIFLYFRTIIILLVNLYMSRVILENLGITDYGVYNAVGGVIAMFSVVSGALSSSISRFITFELGKENSPRLHNIFSSSLNIQIGIAFLIIFISEPIGIWFLNNHMNIPLDRINAANWVLQCSLITFCINLISVPYNACIIAHEKMSAFAYISILEAILKLIVAFTLPIILFDKLIIYAILLVIVAIIVRSTYSIYCKRNFDECHYKFIYDKELLKEMTGFAGWNFLTNTAYIFNTQGVNILINLYFGVALNAARGIATHVEGAVMQFVNNFTMALNPQITKSYAQGNKQEMFSLVCLGSKFSCFLMMFFAIPLIFEADYILSLWLKNVPLHTVTFVQLSVIAAIIDKMGITCTTACLATGKAKEYTIWISAVGSLMFFLTWTCFFMGLAPESAYISYMITYVLVNATRLIIMKKLHGFPISMFIKEVICKVLLSVPLAIIIPFFITKMIEPSFLRLIITATCCTISTTISVLFVGLKVSERKVLFNKLISRINQKKK